MGPTIWGGLEARTRSMGSGGVGAFGLPFVAEDDDELPSGGSSYYGDSDDMDSMKVMDEIVEEIDFEELMWWDFSLIGVF